jgi:hypothetical protein
MELDELYPTIMKKEKNHAEILDCCHPTYTVNTFKFEYLGLCTPKAAHILNLVVWL